MFAPSVPHHHGTADCKHLGLGIHCSSFPSVDTDYTYWIRDALCPTKQTLVDIVWQDYDAGNIDYFSLSS